MATQSNNFKVRRGIEISGSTSGVAVIVPPAAAGTPTLTLPTTTGYLNLNPFTTTGDIAYATNTATPATVGRLAVGTGFQVLGVAAGIPSWTTLTLENLPGAWAKKSVKAATTATITLSAGAPNTLDGVSLSLNDRILVKDQGTGSQNGLYYVSTLGTGANGTWTRTLDGDSIDEIASAVVVVDSGTVNGGLAFDNDTKTTDTLGTTAIVWNRIVDAAYSMNIGTTAVPVGRTSAALTLAGLTLTTPTIADFTNATHTHTNAAGGGTLSGFATDSLVVHLAGTESITGAKTFGTTVVLPAATTSIPSLRIPHGAAPTSPTNGDVWTTTSGMYSRINGVTIGPFGVGGGGATVQDTAPTVPAAGGFWYNSATGGLYISYDSFWVGLAGSAGAGASDATVVHLAGTETITGAKAFTNVITSDVTFADNLDPNFDFIARDIAAPTTDFTQVRIRPTAFHVYNWSAGGDDMNSVMATQTAALLWSGNLTQDASVYTRPDGTVEISASAGTNVNGSFTLDTATASLASLNIPHGTAPSSPTNGDMWTTTAGVYARVNGATVGPFGGGGMTNPLTNNGDIIYGVTTTPTRLPIGTAGQALVTNAGATAPAWATLTLENLPGAFVKKSVKAATTANVATLAGGAPNTTDGISLALNDRVLVKDQTTQSQNGLYYITTLGTGANGTWARSLDADTIDKLASSMVAVDSGTAAGGFTYDNDLKTTDTLGTTACVWNRMVDAGGTTFTGALVLATGTTTLAPLKFASGANLTSAVQGSAEWDGDNLFLTADTSTGSGRQANVAVQRVYLSSAGSAIAANTDYFPSLRPAIKANKLIHFKYWLMFTKNTAGTVTFQMKNSAASNFTFMQAHMRLFLQASGAYAATGDMGRAYAAGAATATFPATKSLTAAGAYAVEIEGWCVAAANTRLSIAPSAYGAGTITTIVGSTMWCGDYGTYNTNYGNLG